ncbi:MAG: VWA domain-containing protein, partial [Clostridiaceae bacterium]|nr:VWA domain-containing protein [Clostridiaceae bacterium]
VYEEIYEDIFVEFSVENVKFEETFPEGLEIVSVPEGFTVDGQTVTGNLSNINYLYNASSNKYEAEPIEFIIKIKGANAGEYSLDSGKLSYKDIDGRNESRNFSEKPFEVVALQALIKVDRGLEEEEIFINKEVDISYTIIPEEFGIDPELEPPSELMVKSVNFSEEFPEGLTIVSASNGLSVTDRKVSGNLGNIIYHYDSKDGKYKAKPVTFNIKLCGDEEGEYTLGKADSSKISYEDLDKETRGKSFTELYLRVVRYGTPKLEVVKLNKRGEVVDVTLRATLPKRTEYGEIRIPVVNEDGTFDKNREKEELLVKKIEVASKKRNDVYTEEFVYKDLSIFKTHRVWLWSVSDFDKDLANETDVITLFEAININ